jgi:hypothetical protein
VGEAFTPSEASRGRTPRRGKDHADPSRATFRPGGNQDHLEVMTQQVNVNSDLASFGTISTATSPTEQSELDATGERGDLLE